MSNLQDIPVVLSQRTGSDLPVLRENADAGGCLAVPAGDRAAWRQAMERILTDPALAERLGAEAVTRIAPASRDGQISVPRVVDDES